MARTSGMTMQRRISAFRMLLQTNMCEAEIRQKLNISQAAMDKLFANAAKQHWSELSAWEPTETMYDTATLPQELVADIKQAAGLKNNSKCVLVRATREGNGVMLSCVADKNADDAI